MTHKPQSVKKAEESAPSVPPVSGIRDNCRRGTAGLQSGTLKLAYGEFEDKAGQLKSPKGAKTELITSAMTHLPERFTLVDIERICPGVSRDMVRKVLKDMQKEGAIACSGRGPGAMWEKR